MDQDIRQLIPSKYLTAILTFIITILYSLTTFVVGGVTEVEVFQIAALVVSAAAIYLVPLATFAWAAGFKVLTAVAGAVLTAIPPIIDTANGGPGWTPETVLTVIIAAFLALATQFGVDVRVDTMTKHVVSPNTNNDELFAVDPGAFHPAEDRAIDATSGWGTL